MVLNRWVLDLCPRGGALDSHLHHDIDLPVIVLSFYLGFIPLLAETCIQGESPVAYSTRTRGLPVCCTLTYGLLLLVAECPVRLASLLHLARRRVYLSSVANITNRRTSYTNSAAAVEKHARSNRVPGLIAAYSVKTRLTTNFAATWTLYSVTNVVS